MNSPVVRRVSRFNLTLTDQPWPFAIERREEINAHFAACRAKQPALWNGRVLLMREPVFAGDGLSARYFQTGFADFLAWRDWGFPDREVFNGFGMGALRARDGAFLLGEMAPDTANAGRIYFPSGTPDPKDIVGATVDIPGSVAREVEEETGLTPSDYRAAPLWHCVVAGQLVGMIRVLDVGESGAALHARVSANLRAQASPELSAVHLVRGSGDFTEAMPSFVTACLAHMFAETGIA